VPALPVLGFALWRSTILHVVEQQLLASSFQYSGDSRLMVAGKQEQEKEQEGPGVVGAL